MIQANELRIGNYINAIDRDCKLCGFVGFYATYTPLDEPSHAFAIEVWKLKPILLTEQIFFDCGFTVNDDLGWYQSEEKSYKVYSNKINIADVDGKYYIWVENDEDSYYNFYIYKEIKYLHQLQNIVFDLIGEELVIKQ